MALSNRAVVRKLLDGLFEVPPLEVTETPRGATLEVEPDLPPLHLSTSDLRGLLRHKLPAIPGLSLIERCGVHWQGYSEFLVNLYSGDEWPAGKFLRFKVGPVGVTVGLASPAFVLLMESVYESEDDVQYGFATHETIRIFPASPDAAKDLLQQALFYLNSNYLWPVGGSASLACLYLPSDHLEPAFVRHLPDLFRSRVRSHPPLADNAPLLIFNDAITQAGEARFLMFYRVLEYFFHRAVLIDLATARYDKGISNDFLVHIARDQKELPQLTRLILGSFTPPWRKRLASFAARKRLITKPDITLLPPALYSYRNSLVHAKELELGRVTLPDPFRGDETAENWMPIVEECASRAIRRFSTTPAR